MSRGRSVHRRGAGVPLVVIHGNGVDHRLLLALDDDIASSGEWERIYLDLPGFGGTSPLDGEGGLPELADWVVETVRGLVGDEPFALLGNSLGGLLVRHVLSQFPRQVLGMALIAPVVDPEPSHRTRPDQSVAESDAAFLESLPADDRDEFTSVAARHVPDSWEAFREFALPGVRAADGRAMDRLFQRYVLAETPEATMLPFDRPTLVVTGRQDHVVGHHDQFRLLDRYPHATYLAVDGAGHNVHLEQRELVGAAVRDWAARVQAVATLGPR